MELVDLVMTTQSTDRWWDFPPGPDVPPLFEHELLEELVALQARFDQLVAAATATPVAEPSLAVELGDSHAGEVWQLDDAALLAEAQVAQQKVAQAHAHWLTVLAEVDKRGVSMRVQHMPTASWLAAGTTHSTRAARAEVLFASRLDSFTAVRDALAAGEVSVEQAGVICQGLDKLPDRLDATQRRGVEEHLVELAADFDPTRLRRLVNHAVDVVAPEVGEEHARKSLDRAEREQARTRYLGWKTDPDDGSLRFWGKLPAAEGELFTQHLSALANAQRVADASMGIDTTRGQALADALALTIAHHASCQGGPVKGGDHTRVLVTLTLDELRTGLGIGTLVESDGQLTAGQARRLACTAGIIPVVLDGNSIPLDLGRSQRLFTPAQRVALALRDGGCVFPGCDRPPADCEGHHAVNPWHAGGNTDIGEGALLCPHHHHLVEPDLTKHPDQNWKITYDERGKPILHTPVNHNGQRITRQHQRFRC